MSTIHPTRRIKVWADIDVGVADFVERLQDVEGIDTHGSCQGTIGEGGAHPYHAHVMVTWNDDAALARLREICTVTSVDLEKHLGYAWPGEVTE